jgi:UDP-2,3-diacylglucosamine pyrophosphatase LpxH
VPNVKSPNLLVISDLHLGEDCKPATKSGYLPHVPLLERELESFLDHYRKSRRDGRPWELIVNGDMVDFLSVCLFPVEGDARHPGDDPDDKVWGLGTGAEAARRKMERVLARHPGVFRALARFVGAGNKLGIVAGNHDVEFHWPIVQDTFRRGMAAIWANEAASRRPGASSVAELEVAIAFHPWFYFQEDLCWIEHGHQYDSYCAFDHFTVPVEPDKEQIVLSLGAASYRYVANHIAGADPHQQEDWNALGYLRFSVGLGLRGLWRMLKGYAGMTTHMLRLWRETGKHREGVERRRTAHRQKLGELATRFKLREETLVVLDDLRQRPLIQNLARLVMAVMLDRVALVVSSALLTAILLIVLPSAGALIAVAAVLASAFGAGQILARLRGHTDPDEHMRRVPQKIRDHVRAPFVVFGHSHQPVALPLADGGWYFNTGTWVATEKPGLLRAFTHLVIRHGEEGAHASLCQWRDGRSTEFMPEAHAG